MLLSPTTKTRRVLLADDHAVLRECLRMLLEQDGEFEVVDTVGSGQEAVAAAERLRPDLVLMDIWLPGLSGIEATRAIRRENSAALILILSMHESRRFVEEALRAGARGYVVKTAPLDELLQAIRDVCAGRVYVSPAVAGHLVSSLNDPERDRPGPLAGLTAREREVLHGIADGKGCKEIAGELRVSPRTVETHRTNLMRKLDVHKTSALVRIAIREGLVAP